MTDRKTAAEDIARSGGALAMEYFAKLSTLEVQDKGPQDFVTEADKNVETHVRDLIAKAYPDDGIVGEEHAPKPSQTGYTWVIDPIDGTANFVSGIPAWCVVIAIVKDDQTQIGVIYDPIHDEMFAAERTCGATLNGTAMVCRADMTMTRGSVGAGYSSRITAQTATRLIGALLDAGTVFYRNASGALSLAYVADGRLLGYIEEHMNAWDCLAGQLLITEAGGRAEVQSADAMMTSGGRVVTGSAGVFEALVKIADDVFPS